MYSNHIYIYIYTCRKIIYKFKKTTKNCTKSTQGAKRPGGPPKAGLWILLNLSADLFIFVYDFPICLYMISVYFYLNFVYVYMIFYDFPCDV